MIDNGNKHQLKKLNTSQVMNSDENEHIESPTFKKEKKTKFKVTFADKIEKGGELTRIHYILSYKEYNAMNIFDMFEEKNETSC